MAAVKYVVRSKMTMTFDKDENPDGNQGENIRDPEITFQTNVTRALLQEPNNQNEPLATVNLPPFPPNSCRVITFELRPPEHRPELPASHHVCSFRKFCPLADTGSTTNDSGDEMKFMKWRQYLSAFIASLLGFSVGLLNGLSAVEMPFLSKFENNNVTNPVNISSAGTMIMGNVIADTTSVTDSVSLEATRICSIEAIGGMIGAVISGRLVNMYGRKMVMFAMNSSCVITWLTILLFSDTMTGIYFSQLMLGVVMGVATMVIPIYNQEISEAQTRGTFGVYLHLMMTFGVLVAFFSGLLFSLSINIVLPFAMSVFIFIFLRFVPESPFFLLRKRRFLEMKNVISTLRGSWMCMEYSAADVTSLVGRALCVEDASHELRGLAFKARLQWWVWRFVTNRGLHIVFCLMFFRQMSGFDAVASYAVGLFHGTDPSFVGEYKTLLLGTLEFGAVIVASLAVEKVGRRLLLLVSSLGMALSLIGLALFHTMIADGWTTDSWMIPELFTSLFVVHYSIGMGPIPWLVMVELTPPEDKAWGVAAAGVINYGTMFVANKATCVISEMVGTQYMFLFSTIFCLFGHVFIYQNVPETKGKNLDQIQRDLDKPITYLLPVV